MPNWCANYVEFYGSGADIDKLNNELLLAISNESSTGNGQTLFSIEVQESYSFFIDITDRTTLPNGTHCLKMNFCSRWSPNLADIAKWCIHTGVYAKVTYEEPGMMVFGYAYILDDGSINDKAVDYKFLEQVKYEDDEHGDSMYSYKGRKYYAMSDLINENYYGERIL